MSKPEPNWPIWRHMPRLSAHEAVALTLGIDPDKVSERSPNKWSFASGRGMATSVPEFGPRMSLFCRCHERLLSFAQLSAWAQSVGWNVPTALAEAAPAPAGPDLLTASDDDVHLALQDVIPAGEDTDELRREIERLGCRFVVIDEQPMLHIPDGTVKGRNEPLSRCYQALCGIHDTNLKAERIGHLLRSSGTTGSGAMGGNGASFIKSVQFREVSPTDEVVNVVPDGLPVPASNMATATELKGVTKAVIIGAFPPPNRRTPEQWEKALGDAGRTVWLKPARVGSGGRRTSALWNPAMLAVCLCDQYRATPQQRRDYGRIIAKHFPEWLPEWQEHAAGFE